MNEKLPDAFDVVVFGTGLTESMVAASISRVDKKVLHIDRNDYYGSQWATFNFETLLEFMESCNKEGGTDKPSEMRNGENLIPCRSKNVKNIVVKSYFYCEDIDEEGIKNAENTDNLHDERVDQLNRDNEKDLLKEPDNNETNNSLSGSVEESLGATDDSTAVTQNFSTISTKTPNKNPSPSMVSQAKVQQKRQNINLEDFRVLSRKFNLDLSPKLLFSAGPLVQAIIKANISHYLEFKLVNRILTFKEGAVVEVPCNRSDVFNSNFLTMIEKRMLMKFLTFCVEFDIESDDVKSYIGEPFDKFLDTKRLSENLKRFITYSIAMVKPDTPTELALTETQKFLNSLGRYGKSPFLWPLFGVGELPQAFCRMCAVFGGIYSLRIHPKSICVNEASGKCEAIIIDDQEIKCDYIIIENSYVPEVFQPTYESFISVAILITNESIFPSSDEHISFLTFPPIEGKSEIVNVIEVGPASAACPNGLFVLYLISRSTSSAFEDLEAYVTQLASPAEELVPNKPRLLWAVYFNQVDQFNISGCPENLLITSMPGSHLGFANAVAEAERIFHTVCPGEEFMLSVPNPEDIIWGHNETDSDTNSERTNENTESSPVDPKPNIFEKENEKSGMNNPNADERPQVTHEPNIEPADSGTDGDQESNTGKDNQ